MAPALTMYGTSTVGLTYTDTKSVTELLDVLTKNGLDVLDTAAIYGGSPGRCEELLGGADVAGRKFVLDTTVLVTSSDGGGSLTAAAIDASIEDQVKRLRVEKVRVLYAHTPDPTTLIVESAAAFDAQYRRGKFEKLGLSNFPPEMVEEWMVVCEKHNYVKPSVFQGQYNLLCRRPEKTLFPLLRKYGISYCAYSPLAGGFLTGSLTNDKIESTRFAAGNQRGFALRHWYDKPEMHNAIRKLESVCAKHDIESTSEAALRWTVYHSILDGDEADAVILGGSRISMVDSNSDTLRKGSLPAEVVEVIEEIWRNVKEVAPQ